MGLELCFQTFKIDTELMDNIVAETKVSCLLAASPNKSVFTIIPSISSDVA
jgi:hypothetical protein